MCRSTAPISPKCWATCWKTPRVTPKQNVRIGAAAVGPADVIEEIVIEDDGPGIAPAERVRMLERGARLDRRGDGAGLGLAIVQDVLGAYGWRLELAASDLGGLKATIAAAA